MQWFRGLLRLRILLLRLLLPLPLLHLLLPKRLLLSLLPLLLQVLLLSVQLLVLLVLLLQVLNKAMSVPNIPLQPGKKNQIVIYSCSIETDMQSFTTSYMKSLILLELFIGGLPLV